MNLKIIHSDFQLNLVDTSFTMIEENNWFSDKIFSKYTFPITKTLTDGEDAAFNFISQCAARRVRTIFDVIFYVLDVEHQAVMEIEKIVGRKIQFQIVYGFEEFPNFEKKLAQLPLHKFVLSGETIFEHAADKIALANADYNFPQIFTDQFDTESPQWEAFLGIINNYTGTVFVENEYDIGEDLQLNRNIMQPLPSLLYLLKTGFLEKGYELAGDILLDPEFKDAYIYSLSEFYSTITDEGKQEMLVKTDEFIGIEDFAPFFHIYETEIIIAEPGKYKLAGNLYLRDASQSHDRQANGIFRLNGVTLAEYYTGEEEGYAMMDINFEILPGESDVVLSFTAISREYAVQGGIPVYDATLLDVTISQLTKYNPDGSANPTLILPNEIDLTKCVPDITFGELYTRIKLWKNYGIDIIDDKVYMNKVVNELGKGTPKDLSHKEVMEPERTFNQGKTFELKFTEIDSKDYEFPALYIDNNGVTQSPYVPKEGSEEIIIDAVPLPRKSENGILTAHGFLDDKQKLQLVLYTGLTGSLNLTNDPAALMMTAIYASDYKLWIDFLLNTLGYLWTFNDFDINVRDLRAKTTVFAYGIYHVIVQLSKKNTGTDGIIQTEIETYSIE